MIIRNMYDVAVAVTSDAISADGKEQIRKAVQALPVVTIPGFGSMRGETAFVGFSEKYKNQKTAARAYEKLGLGEYVTRSGMDVGHKVPCSMGGNLEAENLAMEPHVSNHKKSNAITREMAEVLETIEVPEMKVY